jgi:hypothetical protein
MKRNWLRPLCLASVLFYLAANARADLRVRLRSVTNGKNVNETLLYFKGARQRNDLASIEGGKRKPLGAIIFQCDRNSYVWLDEKERAYWRSPYESPDLLSLLPENPLWPSPLDEQKPSGGTLKETYTLADTGERREIYGYTARRIRATRAWDAAPACRQTPLRQETDGWYIDLLYGFACSPNLSGTHQRGANYADTACLERYRQRRYTFTRQQNGTARLGFPVRETIKTYDDKGKVTITNWEVTEFSETELDTALFDAPAKYKETLPPGAEKSLVSRLLSLLPWR